MPLVAQGKIVFPGQNSAKRLAFREARMIRPARCPGKVQAGLFSALEVHPMEKIEKPLEAWRDELSDAQFHVCRLGGTERAFTGEYHDSKVPGIYHCACCGEAVSPVPMAQTGS